MWLLLFCVMGQIAKIAKSTRFRFVIVSMGVIMRTFYNIADLSLPVMAGTVYHGLCRQSERMQTAVKRKKIYERPAQIQSLVRQLLGIQGYKRIKQDKHACMSDECENKENELIAAVAVVKSFLFVSGHNIAKAWSKRA